MAALFFVTLYTPKGSRKDFNIATSPGRIAHTIQPMPMG
jgi:hypothetical protein